LNWRGPAVDGRWENIPPLSLTVDLSNLDNLGLLASGEQKWCGRDFFAFNLGIVHYRPGYGSETLHTMVLGSNNRVTNPSTLTLRYRITTKAIASPLEVPPDNLPAKR
jgi:hypothetical protein